MNRLADAPSPYLRQHAANPVDWWPWSDAAFAEARRRDVPVFLSVGYATCHWCHVMAHESFEDDATARLLNDAFVCVKVDREERPDVDAVYMAVCQAVTGQGGWPLTVLLTPDQRPFFVGTYIPRTTRAGRAGLDEFVPQVAASWQSQRAAVEAAADRLAAGLRTQFRDPDAPPTDAPDLGPDTLARAASRLMARYDRENGGFGRSLKFPTAHTLTFLVREGARTGDAALTDAAVATLAAIGRGGIRDRLGGGVHRYATDARWRLPHFEKMLYDQALLVLACAEAVAATGDADARALADETLAYVGRDLTAPDGLFFSAEDADSRTPDGRMEEGAFYVWTEAELADALGEADAALARAAFSTRPEGNAPDEATGALTGANILFGETLPATLAHTFGTTETDIAARLDGIRDRLLAVRDARPRPLLDDKVLTDWNGLMVAALAVAARAFGVPEYAARAARAADALLATRRTPGGGLYHRAPQADAGIAGMLDDYAFLAWGLTELYQATHDERHLAAALDLHGQVEARFADAEAGGFFLTDRTAEALLVRPKPVYDGAVPSGAAVAALNGLRLGRVAGRADWEDAARRALASSPDIAAFPDAHTVWMAALAFGLGPSQEVVIAGERGAADTEAMLAAVRTVHAPNALVLLRTPGTGAAALSALVPFTEAQTAIGGAATAYVCSDHACHEPTTDPARAAALLAAAVR